jgi:hypothetical protein
MVRLAVLTLALVLLAAWNRPAEPLAAKPMVESISRVTARQTQTIVIRGRNFGFNPPYDGDSSNLWMVDIEVGFGWWRAGCPQQYGPCGTTLNVRSWTDSEIIITGFTGDGMYPQSGDLVSFFIWNPQTGAGPVAASRMVK